MIIGFAINVGDLQTQRFLAAQPRLAVVQGQQSAMLSVHGDIE
jgi:hypothetical protein